MLLHAHGPSSAHQVRGLTITPCLLPDVMDVAWSPHDAWLASCSVDNTVVIWNAVKFPGLGFPLLCSNQKGLLPTVMLVNVEQGGEGEWVVPPFLFRIILIT